MSFIKERIKEIAINKGIPLGEFFKQLSLAPSGFSGEKIKNGTNSDTIEKIVTLFPDINLYWLITGKGEMLLNEINTLNTTPENLVSLLDVNKKVEELETRVKKFEDYKDAIQTMIDEKFEKNLRELKP